MKARVLILGCGYVGIRLGRGLREAGHPVAGTTRGEARARELREAGIEPLLYDAERPGTLARFPHPPPEAAFCLIPPPRRPDGAYGTAAGPALRALAARGLRDFVYASSTSVYGDRAGAWVDEEEEPTPDSAVGRARLAEERGVLAAARETGVAARIARIAGIYGPGRTLAGAIREGRYHLVEGLDAWSNRIHVDDLVAGLVAVWRLGRPDGVYDLADGRPHRSAELARRTAELLGLELPTITLAEARERYGESRLARKRSSRRVRARKLRRELGVELRHPDFREGLRAALGEEGGQEDGSPPTASRPRGSPREPRRAAGGD